MVEDERASRLHRAEIRVISRRLIILGRVEKIERLPNAEELADLAKTLFEQIRLPANAQVDVEHLALCVFHKIEYLLTWNCRHLANAVLLSKLPELCRNLG